MDYKKFSIYFLIVIGLTLIGLYLSVGGSSFYDGEPNKTTLIFLGRALLWPYWTWSLLVDMIISSKHYFSYIELCFTQTVGYMLLFSCIEFLCNKLKT